MTQNEYQKKWENKQKQKGLCIKCKDPAKTRYFCLNHAKQRYIKDKELQKKKIKNGQCSKCTKQLKTKTRCEYHAKKLLEYGKPYRQNINIKAKVKIQSRIRFAKKLYGEMYEAQVLRLTINDEIRKRLCLNLPPAN